MSRQRIHTVRFDVKVAVDEPIPEARHVLETATELGWNDARFTQHREDVSVVAGPPQTLARNHVMPDIQAGFDDDLQFALRGVLLSRGSEEFLTRERLQPAQEPELVANLRDARRQ